MRNFGRFYNRRLELKDFTFKDLVMPVSLGLFSALIIYALLYAFIESVRVFPSYYAYQPNIFKEGNRNILQLILAFLAVIFGNSIAIVLLFQKFTGILSKRHPKRKVVMNNQVFLNFNFVYWLFKIGACIAFFTVDFVDFSFNSYFLTPFVLLLIVLYLESCKTLIQLIKRPFKFYTFHVLILSVLAFGLSQIEIYDYQKIDQQNLMYKPIIDLPKADFTNVDYQDRFLNVYLKDTAKMTIAYNNHIKTLKDTQTDLIEFKERFHWSTRVSIRLSADAKTKMKYINRIRSQAIISSIPFIIYATHESDELIKRFSRKGIRLRQFEKYLGQYFDGKPTWLGHSDSNSTILSDTIKIKIGKHFYVNDKQISENKLSETITSYINSNTILEYRYSEETSFQNYITFLSCHLSTVVKLRTDNQSIYLKFENFRYTNQDEYDKEQKMLKDKFPINIIETMTE